MDYSVRGEGEPLVLLHGLFGTRENLGAMARQLSETFTVYSLDLPNHGRSPHTDECGLACMAAMVGDWLEQLGIAPIHCFGHSLGGKVAMELALTRPSLVKGLVVADIAPVRYGRRHEDVFTGLRALTLDSLRSRLEADAILSRFVTEKPVRSFLLKNLQKAPDGGFSWRMNLEGLYKAYPSLIQENCAGVFERPVLFLKAEHSDYLHGEYQGAIALRFPAAAFKVVSNTGHWLHAEKPELVARLVQRFLAASAG